MLLPETLFLGHKHWSWLCAFQLLFTCNFVYWKIKAVEWLLSCQWVRVSRARRCSMFQDCISRAGIAVLCDGHNCLHLVMYSQLPSLLAFPVGSICLVWCRLLLLRHLVHVPSAQKPWREWSRLSLGSSQGLPHQTASHCASSPIHRFLWIVSHSGECRWSATDWCVNIVTYL